MKKFLVCFYGVIISIVIITILTIFKLNTPIGIGYVSFIATLISFLKDIKNIPIKMYYKKLATMTIIFLALKSTMWGLEYSNSSQEVIIPEINVMQSVDINILQNEIILQNKSIMKI